jgi:hypothetical protein
MIDVPITTYPGPWEKYGGGIINEGTYIAKNENTDCRLSVSMGSHQSFSLTAGDALSFADGATVLKSGIQSKEEVAALAVRFMREYPNAKWEGGSRGTLVDADGNTIFFP